jgi:thymidylate synthase (FAD)
VKEIKVLDHGFIILKRAMGDDRAVVEAARVSLDQDELTGLEPERDEKLIRYLLRHRHTSPFEHVVFTFVVQAPIFVLRQWHRHRTQSYNEVSARYTEMEDLFFIPGPSAIGVQSESNRQVRELGKNPNAQRASHLIETSVNESFLRYQELLEMKVPRELARVVLPLSIYSRMYATVNLHNLLHFIDLRDDPGAQHEVRVYAQAALDLIKPVVPVCVQAFQELRRGAPAL